MCHLGAAVKSKAFVLLLHVCCCCMCAAVACVLLLHYTPRAQESSSQKTKAGSKGTVSEEGTARKKKIMRCGTRGRRVFSNAACYFFPPLLFGHTFLFLWPLYLTAWQPTLLHCILLRCITHTHTHTHTYRRLSRYGGQSFRTSVYREKQ